MYICNECGQRYAQAGACPADGWALVPWGEDPLLGEVIGNFRISKLLGAGGMGRVYAAVQPAIQARVAIKVLSLDCAMNRDLVDRFFAEARAVNLIRHENIVNVTDLASLPDGRPYMVMEYLDGSSLAGVLGKRGALPLGTAVTLMGEVLDALAAAHAKGIVHRDLKPDNIFVSPGGHAKVLDFGIARLAPELNGMSMPTRAGSIMGTPPYMSPEQAAGQPVDSRSDLYTMGVILYEMVTGGLPFQAQALFDLLRMHIMEPPPPPRARRPDLPAAMEQVILRSLAKAPAQRYQTAEEFAAALGQAAQALPPEAWVSLKATSEGPSARLSPSQLLTGRPMTTGAGPAGRRGGLKWAIGGAVAVIAGVVIFFATRHPREKTTAGDPPTPGLSGPTTPLSTTAPTAPTTPTTPTTTPPPTPAAPTLSYDPKRADPMALVEEAKRLANAKAGVDDFQILSLNFNNIGPDGFADLTLGSGAFVLVNLSSPKLSAPPPGTPKGVSFEHRCYVDVYFTSKGPDVRGPGTGGVCDDKPLTLGRCNPIELWKQAIAKGAPKDAVARVLASPGEWDFYIGSDFQLGARNQDCK